MASRGAFFFFREALLWWPLQVPINLCKRQIPNVHRRHYRETSQTQCKCPYNTTSCHVGAAIRLGRKPSHFGTDRALCSRIFPLTPATCFDRWTPIQRGVHVSAGLLLLHEDAHDSVPSCDVMLHDHPKYSSPARRGVLVSIFPNEASVVRLGIREAFPSPLAPLRKRKHRYLKRLVDKNDVEDYVYKYFCIPHSVPFVWYFHS